MKTRLLLTATLLTLGTSANAAIATFDDLTLAPESAFSPSMDTTFTSGDAIFVTEWNETYNCCLTGFTYSNTTDTTTAGFTNQYSAITGSGVNGSTNYGLSNPNAASHINFNSATSVSGAYFTNTTYAFLAMRDGDDGNATPFVKGPFTDDDFFTLTVNGLDASGSTVSTMDISLATGTDIVDSWVWSDMSSLGDVYGLEFSLWSSDNAFGFINTPAYFAIDDLTTVSAVPVPAAVWLFLSGIVGLVGVARTHK